MLHRGFKSLEVAARNEITEKVKGFVSDLFVDVAIATPVDTGNLVSNWRINSDKYEDIKFYDIGDAAKSAKVEEVRMLLAGMKSLPQKILFTNATPYASQQEGRKAMVATSVLRNVFLFNK